MAKTYLYKTEDVFKVTAAPYAAACLLTASKPSIGYSKLVGIFRTDEASETGSGVRIEQSCNGGTDWDIVSSSCLSTACAASSFDIDIVGDCVRFVFKVGAAAASNTRAHIYLRP